jgi:hypothetical protein
MFQKYINNYTLCSSTLPNVHECIRLCSFLTAKWLYHSHISCRFPLTFSRLLRFEALFFCCIIVSSFKRNCLLKRWNLWVEIQMIIVCCVWWICSCTCSDKPPTMINGHDCVDGRYICWCLRDLAFQIRGPVSTCYDWLWRKRGTLKLPIRTFCEALSQILVGPP